MRPGAWMGRSHRCPGSTAGARAPRSVDEGLAGRRVAPAVDDRRFAIAVPPLAGGPRRHAAVAPLAEDYSKPGRGVLDPGGPARLRSTLPDRTHRRSHLHRSRYDAMA